MRPYILAETNWEAVKKSEFELAILPWGATEAHNYHLPYATDIVEADHIASKSASIAWEKGAKVIVLPTIPFGVNTGQHDILLNMNINPSTQFAILGDIAETLNRQGIKKLLILNSHGGNDFKVHLRELGLKYPDMFFCTTNWYQALNYNLYFDDAGDHAGELETSLMLYLKPEWVLPRNKWGEGKEKISKIAAFTESWAWTERRWSKITQDTGVGNPKLATKDKGEKYFNALTEKMASLFYEVSKLVVNDLYE